MWLGPDSSLAYAVCNVQENPVAGCRCRGTGEPLAQACEEEQSAVWGSPWPKPVTKYSLQLGGAQRRLGSGRGARASQASQLQKAGHSCRDATPNVVRVKTPATGHQSSIAHAKRGARHRWILRERQGHVLLRMASEATGAARHRHRHRQDSSRCPPQQHMWRSQRRALALGPHKGGPQGWASGAPHKGGPQGPPTRAGFGGPSSCRQALQHGLLGQG